MRRSFAGATVALLAAVPAIAIAADPEAGSVSTASPTVKWEGVSSAGAVTTFSQIFINSAGEKTPCQAPSCDTFTLDVKDSADLNVTVTSEATITYLQIEKPDGSIVYNNGIEPEGADPEYDTKLRIKKAPVGTYKIQAAVNAFDPDYAYQGEAVLGTPAPPAPPVAPAPPTAETPASPPAAAPAPATITAKAGKLSARKLARTKKLPLTLNASAPVSGVKVILGAKGKAVATGSIKNLSGTAKYALKLRRKLKPGRYDLVVEGKDANGSAVGVKTAIQVKK